MNPKKLPKVGKILNITLALIIIYIIYTVGYYVRSRMYFDGLLRMPDQPLLLYIFKWIYALLLLIGIMQLNKNAPIAYLLINSTSVAIILFWLLTNIELVYYTSLIDFFFLELVAALLILTTNLGSFIRQYNIKRKLSDLLYIFVIPIIMTVGLYYFATFLINSNSTFASTFSLLAKVEL